MPDDQHEPEVWGPTPEDTQEPTLPGAQPSGAPSRPSLPVEAQGREYGTPPQVRPSVPPSRPAGATTRPANRPAGVTRPQTGRPRPKAKHRWKRIALISALAVVVLGGVLSIGGYFGLYAPARQLASDGAKHLQTAQNLVKQLAFHPLAEKTLAQARDEFSAADDDFQGVNTRLTIAGPFLGLIGFVSGRGDEIQSYVHLAHMALDLSSAGQQALNAAITLIHKEQNALQDPGGQTRRLEASATGTGPAASSGAQVAAGLSMSDISALQQTANTAVSLVQDAWQESQGVTLSALPAGTSIQSAVTLFRTTYPGLHDLLLSLQQTMQVAPQLFGIGHTTTYLAELQDTSERRPTGGFITAIGSLSVRNGQLAGFSLQDTYLLDTPYQASHTTPLPAQDAWFPLTTNWGLRDSNLEPDFPTAAKAAEQLYSAEGGSPVDGVIALTTGFLQDILTITGPVQIPELNEVIDETNLVDRLHAYQFPRSAGDAVSPAALNSPKGQFPALLSKYLLAQLRQQTPAATIEILQEAVLAQGKKDIQLYVNDPRAEHALALAHRAGDVEAPAGDALYVVDTNIAGNKANDNIDEVQQDNVVLDSQGNALHHLVLAYNWKRSAPVYGSSTYTDYVRVYVPPGSQLQGYSGLDNFNAASAYQRTVWSGTFQLVFGQRLLLTITYMVPHAVQDQSGQLHYSLLVQRQSSSPLSRLVLTIGLPQNGTLAQHSGNLHLSSHSATDLLLDQTLDRDTTVTADYN